MRWLSVPLAPLALAFAVGIAAPPAVQERMAWGAWAGGVGTAAVLGAVGSPGLASLPLLVAITGIGMLRAAPLPRPANHIARLPIPPAASIEGTLAAEPIRWTSERSRLLIDVERVDGLPRTGRLQATIYGELPELTHGQRVVAELKLREPSGFRNPGVFDYAAYLARADIHALGSGRADRVVPVDAPSPPWPVRIRRRAVAIMREALPPTSAALLGGLLLGDRTALPREIDDAFRRAGVYHVLAVSGFNVALLAASVFALMSAARASRRWAAAVAMAAIVTFAAVVGPEPSVLRATIMAGLVLGAILLDRETAVLNSLALAALLVLALRPGDLGDPGFQLSFVATAGIVLAPLPRNRLLAAVGVSLAAQLAILPIALAHFNQLSIVGVVANLAVVPLAGIATVLGLAGVILAGVLNAAGEPLLDAIWPILLALRAVVRLAASVPGALVHLPAPPWIAVVAYVSGLAVALAAWAMRREAPQRARALAAAATALVLSAALMEARPLLRAPDGHLRVTVLDVGQGDAIVLEAPDGRAALVDAGPGGPYRLDTGERVVAPFLWNRGHLSLAAALATHADLDHAGGLAAVRRDFRLREGDTPEALISWGRRAGVDIAVFGGSSAPVNGGLAGNETALAFRVELGLASFLLASDMTARTEEDLLRRRAPLTATVLKVAHHGARSSSTKPFLEAVTPAVAVISAGARNAYGHPSSETLARLAAVGAAIYRTDRDGAVTLDTDGRSLTVTTWASRRRDRYCLDPEAVC